VAGRKLITARTVTYRDSLAQDETGARWQHAALWALVALVVVGLMSAPAWARGGGVGFADLAEQLSPAVVNISTEQVIDVSDQLGPDFQVPDSPLGERFRDFLENQDPNAMPRRTATLGSGFIIDSSGIVVTNNHVIEKADEITVNLSDGTALVATILGRDPKTDIAVLKVEPKEPLPFVEFGSSAEARVGDWVVAIGNPFGLGGSVTAGIVSARNREIAGGGPYADYIQTDASINRGNSGGPLFNLDGKVIGVNTAIYSPTGGSVGIGFAIPSDLVASVTKQLSEFGEITRGWLGVRVQVVSDDIAQSMDLPEAKGALVAEVESKSPAAKGGLLAGDLILTFDGKPIDRMRDLPRVVAETKVGARVSVVIVRKGKQKTVQVKVERLKDPEPVIAAVVEKDDLKKTTSAMGLSLSELTQDMRTKYSIKDDVEGVLVVQVAPDSPAVGSIRPGDVIMEVGQEEVSSPGSVVSEVEKTEKQSKEKPVLFLVSRGGAMAFITVQREG